MKKMLLLGGSAQQVIAIDTARRLGLYTILCDYLPDNPGQFHADRFYQTSTTDKEAVLKIAQDEDIDYSDIPPLTDEELSKFKPARLRLKKQNIAS